MAKDNGMKGKLGAAINIALMEIALLFFIVRVLVCQAIGWPAFLISLILLVIITAFAHWLRIRVGSFKVTIILLFIIFVLWLSLLGVFCAQGV